MIKKKLPHKDMTFSRHFNLSIYGKKTGKTKLGQTLKNKKAYNIRKNVMCP